MDSAPIGNTAQPLWEVGVGAIAGTVPDYPAADNYSARFVPFPYFIYRGHLFRSDENGAHLRADVRSNVELDVSGGDTGCPPCVNTNVTEIYDPTMNAWTTGASIPLSFDDMTGASIAMAVLLFDITFLS